MPFEDPHVPWDIGAKWCLVNGVNALPQFTGCPHHPIVDVLKEGRLSHSSVREMVGLGWHINSVGPLLMMVLASVEVRQIVCPLRGSVRNILATNFDLDANDKTGDLVSDPAVIPAVAMPDLLFDDAVGEFSLSDT